MVGRRFGGCVGRRVSNHDDGFGWVTGYGYILDRLNMNVMKAGLILVLPFVFVCFGQNCQAQDNSADSGKTWNFEASTLFYFMPDDAYVLPILKADRKKLHLESRYNYEDFNTFSMFGGYNFSGGKKLQYTFTPMLGFAVGSTDGIAPGLEMDLSLGKFGFYSEMEYLFDLNDKENGYYYNWSEFTFAPTDWMWLGISGQRLRAYETELDLQRGILAGFALKRFEVSGYYFNPFSSDQFGIVSLSFSF
jgi:hypothetical protein